MPGTRLDTVWFKEPNYVKISGLETSTKYAI